MANKPEGYKYPELKYFGITAAGMSYFALQKWIIYKIFKPYMYKWCA